MDVRALEMKMVETKPKNFEDGEKIKLCALIKAER